MGAGEILRATVFHEWARSGYPSPLPLIGYLAGLFPIILFVAVVVLFAWLLKEGVVK